MIFARAADLKRTGLKTPHYRAGSRSRVRSSGLGAIACLLIATCRKFTVLLANAGVDASNLRILLGFCSASNRHSARSSAARTSGSTMGTAGSETVGVVGAERRARGAIRGPLIKD